MPQRNDAGMTLLSRAGETETYGNGFWRHPWLIRGVVGPDGRRHTVYLWQDADTFFSWPGRMKVGGRWIKGFISMGQPPAPFSTLREIPDEPIFTPYSYQE